MMLQFDWDLGQYSQTETENRRELSINAPPLTSFPGLSQLVEANAGDVDSSSSSIPTTPTENGVSLEDQLKPLLIVSDTAECNNNLSCYLKEAVDGLYGIQEQSSLSGDSGEGPSRQNYQRISLFSLRLITLNLFVKNQSLCIGKLLSLLAVLGQTTCSNDETRYEGECLKEFICITLLLVLKSASNYDRLESQGLLLMLEDLNFVGIIFRFLISHINNINNSSSSYKILKFVCDIVFEYLYQVEHLSDNEFQVLSLETSLIPTIIKTLFDNDSFNNYDIDDDADNEAGMDESKVIAYEEFKLLLLLNEQYLMKSYTKPEIENKVFTSLLEQLGSSGSNISGFINMVVCYLNREESQILKILMLKFLYLIFTTSCTSKLFYLNDLKILVDIFIRELNDMDLSGSIEIANENRLLTITYLKVMYPLLMFSQLNELEGGYKNEEIIELFSYLIVNANSSGNGDETTGSKSIQDEQNEVISKLAVRCLSINWLKKSNNNSPIPKNSIPISNNRGNARDRDVTRQSNNNSPSLSSSVTLNSSLTYKSRPGLYQGLTNSSQESIGAAFTRIASVRTSNKNDIHRTTTLHNLGNSGKETTTNVLQNNNNVFLAKMNSLLVKEEKEVEESTNILNLPKEYLVDKKSTLAYSSLIRKAIMKKAPPPPSTSPSPRNSNYSPNNNSRSSTPINTPPPCPIPGSRLNAALPALPFPPPPPPPRRRR